MLLRPLPPPLPSPPLPSPLPGRWQHGSTRGGPSWSSNRDHSSYVTLRERRTITNAVHVHNTVLQYTACSAGMSGEVLSSL
jgi:hypothetical protein